MRELRGIGGKDGYSWVRLAFPKSLINTDEVLR